MYLLKEEDKLFCYLLTIIENKCDPILENQPYHGNYDSEQSAHKDEKSLIWQNTFYHINNLCNEIPFI